jgi:hypothetical protein
LGATGAASFRQYVFNLVWHEGPEVDCRRFRELIADATPNAVEEITWDSGWAQSLAKEILGVPVFDY